jgi:D-lactate dehydrogenase
VPQLLRPDPRRIAPANGAPAEDRAPDALAIGTPEPLRTELINVLGEDRLLSRPSDLIRYASDASPYRLLPRAVVMAHDAHDVAKTLRYARDRHLAVTFRAGGTSLNGQALGDGILIDVRRHFAGIRAEDEGRRARVRPGTLLGRANLALAKHGRRLGPDPASTDIATVGGVIANNSGGMRCGVTHDSYQTVLELTFLLASGTLIDSAAPDAEVRFAREEPDLARGLTEMRDQIRADEELSERIRTKFRIKNTTGYRLCAFLDADTPVQIFRRLLVGSEGTLGFVTEAVFETVPIGRHDTAAWFLFPDIDSAIAVVRPLVELGASATEIMMTASLVAAQNFVDIPDEWRELPLDGAGILCEFRSDDESSLAEKEEQALAVMEGRELLREPSFTRDPDRIHLFWRVREGMHGLVGKMRPEGTSLIVEDVCVPPERIAEAAGDLRELLAEHGFIPGVAGHASAGNLHFMLTPKFDEAADRERYDSFMGALVELVLDKYDGSLKAEHGTGLNMAPFVEREWGPKATEMMWRIKRLADPDGVLAPGVVLNRDPEVHLKNLKTQPPIEDEATACVECGFCEPVCPSRDLTTTPRQRILLRREIARQPAGSPLREALLEEYEYDAIETCAADGTCRLACPVGIDTGKLIKQFRGREHSRRAEAAALAAARRYGTVERAARRALAAGNSAGPVAMRALTAAGRALVSEEVLPSWLAEMPPAAPAPLPATRREDAHAVYFPACINRIFGPPDASVRSLPEALVAVSARAGRPLWIPGDVCGRCCGMPWHSKGFRRGAEHKATEIVDSMWAWTDQGRLPLVTDATSCTGGLLDDVKPFLDERSANRHERLEIVDSVAWVHDELLHRLEPRRRVGAATVHPPCAARHLGLVSKLQGIAEELADEVHVPLVATCCGFAGDRGFLHPELTESATRTEAREVTGRRFDAHLSSNRTCEIGMERGTGSPYVSPAQLLDRLT